MKSKFTLLSLYILFSFTALAQDSLQTGYIKYNTIFQENPNEEIYTSYNAFLNFNNNESLYTSHRIGMDSIASLGSHKFNENGFSYTSPTHDKKGLNYYRNFESRKIIFNSSGFGPIDPFIVNDDWLEMDWNIKNDFKEIADHKVQKATTTFRGTDFEVWFTTDVPLPYGPMKLFGLPGVILEVWFKNLKIITAYEICYPCETIFTIDAPTEPIVKTIKEYVHFHDNLGYYLFLEMNKKAEFGNFTLNEMPTEKKIQEKRDRSFEKLYEWENEKTKRLVPKKDLEKIVKAKKKEEKPKPTNDLYFRPEPMSTNRF